MPLMDPNEPSRATYQQDKEAIWRELRDIRRQLKQDPLPVNNHTPNATASDPTLAHPGIGDEWARWDHIHASGVSSLVFVQPNEPPVHIVGTLWYDTDEPC